MRKLLNGKRSARSNPTIVCLKVGINGFYYWSAWANLQDISFVAALEGKVNLTVISIKDSYESKVTKGAGNFIWRNLSGLPTEDIF